MTRWRQAVTAYAFIGVEALAWFLLLRALGTAAERGALDPLARDLQQGLAIGLYPDQQRAQVALDAVRAAIRSASGGPSLWVVLATAWGGCALMRRLAGSTLPRTLRVLIGLLTSIIALQALVHITLAGDPWVWNTSAVARLLAGAAAPGSAGVDTLAFIAHPDLTTVTGSAVPMTVFGVTALWVRALLAGRHAVTFPQVLRSFTVGFLATLLAVIVARPVHAAMVGPLSLLYFVLAMLVLSLAHAARVQGTAEDDAQHAAPWAISVGGTLAIMGAITGVGALLVLLDVPHLLAPAGTMVLHAVGWVLMQAMRPIFAIIDGVLRLLLHRGHVDTMAQTRNALAGVAPDGEQTVVHHNLPGWLLRGGRAVIFVALAYIVYRIARLVFAPVVRRSADSVAVERTRETTGSGSLLRRLLPSRLGSTGVPDWLRAHPIYRLYARLVSVGQVRGVPRWPGATAIEYATIAAARLRDAPSLASAVSVPAPVPPFTPIAEAFDRARYGRHYPSDADVDRLAAALAAWEQAYPPGTITPPPDDRADSMRGPRDPRVPLAPRERPGAEFPPGATPPF